MFDVLVYLFENFYQSEGRPDHETLARKLHAAGFENEDIHDALDWLNGLAAPHDTDRLECLDVRPTFRTYNAQESAKLTTESRGFLAFLESAGILPARLREVIIERAMALSDELVGLDKFKVIVLMVLWTQRGSVDALVLDELLPDGEKRQMH
jgi:Smg protein